MDDRTVDLLAENIDVALRMGVLTDSALKAASWRKLSGWSSPALLTWRAEGCRARQPIYSNMRALFMARVRADRNGSFVVARRKRRYTSGRA
jgi:hypothetical protein